VPFLAFQQVRVERPCGRKNAQHLSHVEQLHLCVTQRVKHVQVVFEGVPRFFDPGVGNEFAEQVHSRQQPPGFHSRIMNGFLGEFLLASFELFPIPLPLGLERRGQEFERVR
jgi:hypothetical protein